MDLMKEESLSKQDDARHKQELQFSIRFPEKTVELSEWPFEETTF
jgi:hypothetical protein